MLNRKAIVDVLIVVMTLAAFVVGMCAVQKGSYQNGFTTARSLVENSPIGDILRTPIQTAADVRALFGIASAVNSDSITLHISSINPFDTPSLNDRIVRIATSTKITTLIPKDPTVFQRELAAYTKAMEAGSKSIPQLTPPAPVIQTVINFAGIKIGDALMVIASANIKSVKEFTASEINILPSITPPAIP